MEGPMYESESLWETVVIRREELYERIWAEPALKVGAFYGMTGTGIAKICRKLAIPVPALKPGAPVEHRIERLKKRRYAEFSDAARQAAEHERDPGQKIVVPEVLTDPHRLVRSSERLVRRVAAKSAKAKDPPKFCPSPSLERRCLDIAVAEPWCHLHARNSGRDEACPRCERPVYGRGRRVSLRSPANVLLSVEEGEPSGRPGGVGPPW